MKVHGGVTQTQVVEGSISKEELLALVRETFAIPEGAKARFYVHSSYGLMQLQIADQCAPHLVDVSTSEPLRFRITWEVPVAPKQG